MGYDTSFNGTLEITPPLPAAVVAEWNAFAQERHEDGPSFYCQWVPSDDGVFVEWDYNEKFYEAECWMVEVLDRFVKPAGCVANGRIDAQGEDPEDRWYMDVRDNRVFIADAIITFGDEREIGHESALSGDAGPFDAERGKHEVGES